MTRKISDKRLTKKQAREEWKKALKSSKYKQCQGQLSNGVGYCCLGVACEVYNKHHTKKLSKAQIEDFVEFDGYDQLLPPKVQKWLGLSDAYGTLMRADNLSLVDLNDSGDSFKEIANTLDGVKLC